jgi:uncharacterized membrane protein YkvI
MNNDKRSGSLWSILNRFLLPGLAFKAVVIGGGYATGRELVEFFMPAGPVGGLWGMTLAMLLWSGICAVTFLFAYRISAADYHSFFRALLGRFDGAFEIIYFGFLILVLSVFGSAAGALGTALFGLPPIVGTLALIGSVLVVIALGQGAAEALFKYVSVLLYGVFAIFLALCLWFYTPQISLALAQPAPTGGWFEGGLTYASYNVIGAVLILPVLRHLQSDRDAVVSGLLAGPLAMIPAFAFFICLIPFYPGVLGEALPSDFVLRELGIPAFHFTFQAMVFFALLECSVGFVQALMARVDVHNERRGRLTPPALRIIVPAVVTVGSVFIAANVGLVDLIAKGYRLMAYAVLLIYIAPLLTVGLIRLWRGSALPRPT